MNKKDLKELIDKIDQVYWYLKGMDDMVQEIVYASGGGSENLVDEIYEYFKKQINEVKNDK
jgi:hypothetical protein